MGDAELTVTGYITLGLLSSRDWSAYQLAEQVGRGVDQLWARADRQRYNTPKRLLERGLVTARSEAVGKRSRTVYSITPAGRDAVASWLHSAPREASQEFEGMIRVLVADQGTIADLRASLETVREQSIAARAQFAGYAAYIAETGGSFPERQHLFALVNTYMIGHHDHVIEWATWALRETADWSDTISPATGDPARVRAMLAPGLEHAAR